MVYDRRRVRKFLARSPAVDSLTKSTICASNAASNKATPVPTLVIIEMVHSG